MALEQWTVGMGTAARASVAALVVCLVAGCPGGGGDSSTSSGTSGQQFIVTPANVGFAAANNTSSPTPPSRTVMATVSGPTGGTLFARLAISGDAVDVANSSVEVLNANQARITIRPVSPIGFALGNHASVITVIACNADPNCLGPQIATSPATINVAYHVGPGTTPPAPPQSLAPSVGAASVQGDVVLRGSGFTNVTSVTFAGTPAADFTVMSDTEIRATYPALAAGVKNISLNSGAVTFGPSLTLIPAGAVTAATLSYPVAGVVNMRGLAYDPVTPTLFVGAGFATPTTNQVVAFTFASGAWQTLPPPATLQNLRNLTLSLDRTRLLALTDTTVVDLVPTTFFVQATTTRTTDANTLDSFLKGIVATNDGQAFIVSSNLAAINGQHWLYNVAAPAFSGPFNSYTSPEIGGPDNGTRVVIVRGGGLKLVQQYSAFTGSVSDTSFSLAHSHPDPARQENINLPVFDRNGNRMLVAGFSGGTFHAVYDANFGELGRLPSSDLVGTVVAPTAAYAISPDATRAYILQIGTGVCRVRAFDLRTPPGPGALYQEVTVTGFPINLSPNCPAKDFTFPSRMLLDPTGTTLFIAGELLIRVVTPLP